MEIKKDCLYTKSHEWVLFSDDTTAKVGLTDYAQSELGDLVFVNLPQEGDDVTAGETFADVESVKAVSDVFSPVTGKVSAVNEELLDAPQKINEDAFGAWFMEVSDVSDKAELMDAAAYQAFVDSEKK